MGWHFYLTAGANLQIREAYEHYLLYYSLLKIDLQMIFMMMYTVLIVGLYERAYALLTCGVAIGVMEMLWVKKGLLGTPFSRA